MKQLIAEQVQFILLMTMSGMALMAGYDVLRIFRWLFSHGEVSIAAEDILYWTIVSVPVFYLFLEYHDGIIRWYGIVAVFSGIILYEYGLSRPVRSRVSAFFDRIRRKWRKKRERIREKRKQEKQKKQEIRNEKRKERKRLKQEKREKAEQEKRERQKQEEERRGQKRERTERERQERREREKEIRRQKQEKAGREGQENRKWNKNGRYVAKFTKKD